MTAALTADDYRNLEARWITSELADAAKLRRVDAVTGREMVGRKTGDFAGIAIPYFLPGQTTVREYRIRRDHPDLEQQSDGTVKERKKYVSPPGRGNLLYIPPMIPPELLTRVEIPIVLTEGEFKALALWRLSNHDSETPQFLPIGLGGVWNWRGTVGKAGGPNGGRRDVKGVIPDFNLISWTGRSVIIAFDADARANRDVMAARDGLAGESRRRGARAAFLEWDPALGKGIDDHIAVVGPDRVLREIAALDFKKLGTNAPAGEGQQETVAQILEQAGLSQLRKGASIEEIEEALRKLTASAGGADSIRRVALRSEAIACLANAGVTSPARFIDAALKEFRSEGGNGEGRELLFIDLEPWPDPVDGEQLLRELAAFFERFVVLPKGGAAALSLWVLHTYALAAAYISPILAIVSPEKRCGKTVLLDVLFRLVWRPITVANITAASLFRAVEKWTPTLLVDEADSFLTGNDELRGVINSGHRRDTAKVIRTVGDEHEPRVFSTWGAKAIALIGRLPATLEDRAILLPMKRRTPGEQVERFRPENVSAELEVIRRKSARWAADNLGTLREFDPSVPEALNDRAQDNWRPLLAIVDAIGGPWPNQARKAAVLLSSQSNAVETSAAVQLLADLRDFFQETNQDFLASEDVVEKLLKMEERPWGEWKKGKPITKIQVAALLRKFGIRPKQHWHDSGPARGYERADLTDAFNRYLPSESVDSVGINVDKGLSEVFDSVGSDFHNDRQKQPEGPSMKEPTDPTDSKRRYEAKDGLHEGDRRDLLASKEPKFLPAEELEWEEGTL